jgi:hypothetical protein
MFLITLAGLPPTIVLSGTSFVTTASEATTTLLPIVTPGLMTARPPIHTLLPIVTGLPYSGPFSFSCRIIFDVFFPYVM